MTIAPDRYAARVGDNFSWTFRSGLVYPQFNDRIHVVVDHDPPKDCSCYESIDPGWSDPCSVGFYYVTADGQKCRYDEIYGTGITDEILVQKIKEKRVQYGSRRISNTVIDPNSNKKMQTCPEGLWAKLNQLGILVSRGTRHIVDPDGIAAVATMLGNIIGGQPEFTACRRCTSFVEEIKHYSRNDKGVLRDNHNHAMDELRNLLMTGFYYSEAATYDSPRDDSLIRSRGVESRVVNGEHRVRLVGVG
jgi:hypothetical protein